jgi:hypothetical protein
MLRNLFVMLTVIFLVLGFIPNAFSGDIQNSSLIPGDRVTVFRDGEKIAEYTKEMPVPEGSMLFCEGRCVVKLNEIAMVVEDKSTVGIDSQNNSRYLYVKDGTVYFGISAIPQPLVFLTPAGSVSANQVILKAAADTNMLEGYVSVGKNGSELGVIDGGSLRIATSDGQKILHPGQRILLAQADMGGGAAGGGTGDDDDDDDDAAGFLTTGTIAAIVGVAAVGGIIIHNTTDGNGKKKDGSPSMPE